MVHANFQLRGEESDRDEAFVRELAKSYGKRVLVQRFATSDYAAKRGLSIQEAARELRYQWFRELKQEQACDYTLLAHHANDNAETVLMNFLRGTGLHGLTGMPDKDTYFLRPLLRVPKKALDAFASEHSLNWVEDSSNRSSKYTRNYLRNELLPQIRRVYPQADENLLDNIERFKKTERLHSRLVAAYLKKICIPIPSGCKVPVKILQQQLENSLIYEWIKAYGFGEKQVPEVQKLLVAESGRYIANAGYRIIRHRNHLLLVGVERNFDAVPLEKEQKLIHFDYHRQLTIEHIASHSGKWQKDEHVAELDAKLLQWPLLLRKWRPGDYFYPLGLGKKKKLSRFFMDRKLPKTEKEQVWILESGGRIAWVVGMRIDDRFKVTGQTGEVVRFTLTSL